MLLRLVFACSLLLLALVVMDHFDLLPWNLISDSSEIKEELEESEPDWQEHNSGYYYSFLSETEQKVYRSLYFSCEEFLDVIELSQEVSESELFHAVTAFSYDHPEYYWMNHSYTYYSDGEGLVHSLQFEFSGNELANVQRMKELAEEVISKLPEDPYEAYQALYEYVIQSTEYDAGIASEGQDMTSVFFEHRSVCAGYSKAFQFLCHKAGLPCVYVTGTAVLKDGTQAAHAWNLITINGMNYWADTTWGDPTFEDAETALINYNYFCVSDTVLSAEHKIDTLISSGQSDTPLEVSYPSCVDDSLDWYRRNECYFETYDSELIKGRIQEASSNQEETIFLKFSDYDELMSAVSDLIYRENCFRYINEAGISCHELSYLTYDGVHALWIMPVYGS